MSEKVDTKCSTTSTALIAVRSNSGNSLISCIKAIDSLNDTLDTELKLEVSQVVYALSKRITVNEIEMVKKVYEHVYDVCNAACSFISEVEEFYRMNKQDELEIEAMITEASNKKCEKMHGVLGQLLRYLKQIQNNYDKKFLPTCKTAEEAIKRVNNECQKKETDAASMPRKNALLGGTGGVVSGVGIGTGIVLVAASTAAAPIVIGGALIAGTAGGLMGSLLGYWSTDKQKVEAKVNYENLQHCILILEGQMNKVYHAVNIVMETLEALLVRSITENLEGITSKELDKLKSLKRLSTVITRLEKQVAEGNLSHTLRKSIRMFFELINKQANETLPTVKKRINEVELSLQAIHKQVYSPGVQGQQHSATSK